MNLHLNLENVVWFSVVFMILTFDVENAFGQASDYCGSLPAKGLRALGNPTGKPLGGGDGYGDWVTLPPKVVDNRKDLIEDLIKEEFVQAVKGLGTAVIDLAGKAADAANSIRTSKAAEDNKTLPTDDLILKPNLDTFTSIANFVALSAFYGLEKKKTEALKAAAKEAHGWIEKGSKAVVDVMMSTQFEIARPSKVKLDKQIEVLQGAGEVPGG